MKVAPSNKTVTIEASNTAIIGGAIGTVILLLILIIIVILIVVYIR